MGIRVDSVHVDWHSMHWPPESSKVSDPWNWFWCSRPLKLFKLGASAYNLLPIPMLTSHPDLDYLISMKIIHQWSQSLRIGTEMFQIFASHNLEAGNLTIETKLEARDLMVEISTKSTWSSKSSFWIRNFGCLKLKIWKSAPSKRWIRSIPNDVRRSLMCSIV